MPKLFKTTTQAIATEGSTKAEDLLANEIARLQAQINQDQEIQWNYAKSHNLPLTTEGAEISSLRDWLRWSAQLLTAENERKYCAQLEAAKKEQNVFSIPDV